MSTTHAALDWQSVARSIDHTLLKPDATRDAIARICREAIDYHFAAVCVQPCHIEQVAKALRGSDVKTASVIGFPQGANLTATKAQEAAEVIRLGANEVDMVINVGALKSGDSDYVRNDVAGVVQAAHGAGAIVKVIIETSLLTTDEKALACKLAVEAGADFVKTSTGFAGGGATVEDIALMRATVGANIGVKASGGIRSGADAVAMLKAGATRIGASASVQIVRDLGAPEVK